MLILAYFLLALFGISVYAFPTSSHSSGSNQGAASNSKGPNPGPQRSNSKSSNSQPNHSSPFDPKSPSKHTSTASPCSGNSASDRAAWCDYNLSTNYYDEAPNTGVTREYWLELVNTTLSPDGYERNVLVFNGTLPGPTLFADWGDTVIVHVRNALANNGTSIHFHGIRQNQTNSQDGVVSITQCPVAPGQSLTYQWRADQYGTSWYHSHFGLQAWEGAFGGIVINGPASSNYDTDAGILFLNDWSHETADTMFPSAEVNGRPTLDNGLINGTNLYAGNGTLPHQAGSRYTMGVNHGESYRLRLVNAAIDTHFKFSVDGHTLTVIAMDLVPIQPYTTEVLNIAIGQRYDVILTASQPASTSNYWIRAIPQASCSYNSNSANIKGILHYSPQASALPTTTAYPYTDECIDEPSSSLVPVVSTTAGTSFYSATEELTFGFTSDNLFRWLLNDTSFVAEWDSPTLLQVLDNNLINNNVVESTFTTSNHIIDLPLPNKWVYFVIETEDDSHPIHLHGHDFLLLASSPNATYSPTTTPLNTVNPPRRDVATLPAAGFLVIAFVTDNPGAWLLHCHIGWHQPEGLALQFLERGGEIFGGGVGNGILGPEERVLRDTCASWEGYTVVSRVGEGEDSGI